jgi:hypothetical protein
MPRMLTIVALDRLAAAVLVQSSDVTASKLPEMSSVGMLLAGGWRTAAGAAGTFQMSRQSSFAYAHVPTASPCSEAEYSGNACRPAATRSSCVAKGYHSRQTTPNPRPYPAEGTPGPGRGALATRSLATAAIGHQRRRQGRARRRGARRLAPQPELGVADRCRQRLSLELVDQFREGLLETRMGGVAGRFRRAGAKQVVEPGACVQPKFRNGDGERYGRIENNAADALRVIAHERLREIRAIGHA